MTREEALTILDTIPTIGEQVDALEMAIETLEKEPCEDCVSRQAIFENRKLVYKEYASTDNEKTMMEQLAKLDEELPSVQPARTKARWIDNSDGGRVWNPFQDRYTCSNCGKHSDLENYCCNCGAEMEDE